MDPNSIDLSDVSDITQYISPLDVLLFGAGVMILLVWAGRTHFGTRALRDTPPRRNSLPAYAPFIPFFIWFAGASVAMSAVSHLDIDLDGWRGPLVSNLIYSAAGVVAIISAIPLARAHFARRLKGFGFDFAKAGKDLAYAFVNLLGIYPILLISLLLTLLVGLLLQGKDFQLAQHEQLKLLGQYPNFWIYVAIFVLAVFVAPVIEEITFRGLLQTLLRNYLKSPWLAIAIASALFASIHFIPAHWPTLFFLAVCLGYAYEKSGSLLRPIFIHAIFNAMMVISVIIQSRLQIT